jgi:hypothetical protein
MVGHATMVIPVQLYPGVMILAVQEPGDVALIDAG